jgi:phenylacetate-CoA ligase
VRRYDQVDEFQIRLYTADGIRDEIEVLVEGTGGQDLGALLPELSTRLSEAHEGLRIPVRQAEAGSLPRFELKARRLVDNREAWKV